FPPNPRCRTGARYLPVTVTVVPPAAGPVDGDSVETCGAGTKEILRCTVPHALETEMVTRPAVCAGILTTRRRAVCLANEYSVFRPIEPVVAEPRRRPAILR